VAVSKSEQLPEDCQVRPKHAAVDCDFKVILNYGEIVNRDALKIKVNVYSYLPKSILQSAY
jgi:uncharacterized alkaline shock family protein YloU